MPSRMRSVHECALRSLLVTHHVLCAPFHQQGALQKGLEAQVDMCTRLSSALESTRSMLRAKAEK